MKVSVIIPVFNVEEYIEASFSSVLNQTYGDIECLLVDDCGNDRSMDIVERMVSEHPSAAIRILHHPKNMGLSAARNTGLENSEGEYVFFLDSDDTITPNAIEEMVRLADEYGADVVDMNVSVFGGSYGVLRPYEKQGVLSSDQVTRMFLSNEVHVSAWNKLIRKRFLTDNGIRFVAGLIYEDIPFTFTLCRNVKNYVIGCQYTYNYLIRKNSIISNPSNQAVRYDSIVRIVRFFDDCIIRGQYTSEIGTWLSNYRFKMSSRLTAMQLTYKKKKTFYEELNEKGIRSRGRGWKNRLLALPFPFFCAVFFFPYKFYQYYTYKRG